jgi:hypothetical protein
MTTTWVWRRHRDHWGRAYSAHLDDFKPEADDPLDEPDQGGLIG